MKNLNEEIERIKQIMNIESEKNHFLNEDNILNNLDPLGLKKRKNFDHLIFVGESKEQNKEYADAMKNYTQAFELYKNREKNKRHILAKQKIDNLQKVIDQVQITIESYVNRANKFLKINKFAEALEYLRLARELTKNLPNSQDNYNKINSKQDEINSKEKEYEDNVKKQEEERIKKKQEEERIKKEKEEQDLKNYNATEIATEQDLINFLLQNEFQKIEDDETAKKFWKSEKSPLTWVKFLYANMKTQAYFYMFEESNKKYYKLGVKSRYVPTTNQTLYAADNMIYFPTTMGIVRKYVLDLPEVDLDSENLNSISRTLDRMRSVYFDPQSKKYLIDFDDKGILIYVSSKEPVKEGIINYIKNDYSKKIEKIKSDIKNYIKGEDLTKPVTSEEFNENYTNINDYLNKVTEEIKYLKLI